MFRLDITTTPSLGHVAGEFGLLASRMEDQSKLLRDIVDQIVRPAIRANFATEGSHSGSRWAPLSEFTTKMRGASGPILDRGRGAVGLKYVAQQKNLWTFQRIGLSEDHAFISIDDAWSRIPYGVAHQFGYMNALTGTKVPARAFWVLSADDIARIEQATGEWADKNIRSSIGA